MQQTWVVNHQTTHQCSRWVTNLNITSYPVCTYVHTYSIHNLHFMVHHWIDYQLLQLSIRQKVPSPHHLDEGGTTESQYVTVPLACTHQEVNKQKIG